MNYIPLEVFLKRNFTFDESMMINPNDIWTRQQNDDDLRFEVTDGTPSSPIGKNRNMRGGNGKGHYYLTELYLHTDTSTEKTIRSFFLEPRGKGDVVYKLKNEKR